MRRQLRTSTCSVWKFVDPIDTIREWLTNLRDRRTLRPPPPEPPLSSCASSTSEKNTTTKSNAFHASRKYLFGPSANSFTRHSHVNTVVKNWNDVKKYHSVCCPPVKISLAHDSGSLKIKRGPTEINQFSYHMCARTNITIYYNYKCKTQQAMISLIC